jgi:hypothetical protein
MAKLGCALLIAAVAIACESAPAPVRTAPSETALTASTTPAASIPATTAPTPGPTQCSKPAPSLVPALTFQNGNLDLNTPYRLGFVQFNLVPCREIDAIRAKYELGAAALVITEPANSTSDPDDIRSRYFRAAVPAGMEAAFVTRLAAHPEDFQYVEFAFVTHACAVQAPPVGPLCFVASTVEPKDGPTGTSFTMHVCCFSVGAPVTKTFILPSGRTIVIRDHAGEDETVLAGWAGSAFDERGVYTVTVTSDEIGSTVRFRIS